MYSVYFYSFNVFLLLSNIFFNQTYRQALATTLSALYGKLLVVMGIAFPMSEVISTHIPHSFYEVTLRLTYLLLSFILYYSTYFYYFIFSSGLLLVPLFRKYGVSFLHVRNAAQGQAHDDTSQQ